MGIYRSPEDEERTIFDTFPTAGELKKTKREQKFQTVLNDILSKLKEEDSTLVTYAGIIPEECIDFLNKRGYTVLERDDRILANNGKIKYLYNISY